VITIHVHHHFGSSATDIGEALLAILHRLEAKMSALDDAIAQLQQEVAQNTSVTDSAVALISNIPTLINTAVQEALAAGATPAQLQAITDLSAKLDAESTKLGTAVTANTPAPPPVTTPGGGDTTGGGTGGDITGGSGSTTPSP
jgi:hypothetical protein